MIWFKEKRFTPEEYQVFAEAVWNNYRQCAPKWDGELNATIANATVLRSFKNIHPRIWFYVAVCNQAEILRLRRELAKIKTREI